MPEGPLKLLAECASHLFNQYVATRLDMAKASLSSDDVDEEDELDDKVKYPRI